MNEPKDGYGDGDSDPFFGDPGDSEGGDSDDTDDPDDPNPEEPPDDVMEGDCPPGTTASFSEDEIYVKSDEMQTASGTLSTDEAGWYHIYDYSLAESGTSQTNESIYLRISNGSRPEGQPYWGNCEEDWVVADSDNEGFPKGDRIYVGTFWLDAGDNALTLNHYCLLYDQGLCPEFHVTSDSGSTCDSGPNSAHLQADGICMLRVELDPP